MHLMNTECDYANICMPITSYVACWNIPLIALLHNVYTINSLEWLYSSLHGRIQPS